jgi:membrane-associated HD superfamily phosphohydrolase
LRESSNIDEYDLNIRLPADNEYGYNLISYKFTDLIESCKNLSTGINDESGDYNSGNKNDKNYNENCDNFYKTYCKTMRLLHDINDDKYLNNKNLYRDHILYGENTGLECGCLNSPLYYTKNRTTPDDVLKLVDFNCNDSGYKTKEMQSDITTYTNCSVNVGTGIDANLVNINNVQINNDCGTKQSKTNIDQSNNGINSNLSNNEITNDNNKNNNYKNNNNNNKIENKIIQKQNTELSTNEKTNVEATIKEESNSNNNVYIIIGIIVIILIIIMILYLIFSSKNNNNTEGGHNNIIYQYYNNDIGDLYKLN